MLRPTMGADKRKTKRINKRYTVRFGQNDLSHTGFTADVSLGGLFIVCSQLPALNARLLVQINNEGKAPTFVIGVVSRHKMVPPELRTLAKNGFGLRVLKPEELLRPLVPQPSGATNLACVYETEEIFKRAWVSELRHGGVFIRTSEAYKPQQELQVKFTLTFAAVEFVFACKVVHLAGPESGNAGVGVLFNDPNAARATLGGFATTS